MVMPRLRITMIVLNLVSLFTIWIQLSPFFSFYMCTKFQVKKM